MFGQLYTVIDNDSVKRYGLTPRKRYRAVAVDHMLPKGPENNRAHPVFPSTDFDIDGIGDFMVTVENDDGQLRSYGSGFFDGPAISDTFTDKAD